MSHSNTQRSINSLLGVKNSTAFTVKDFFAETKTTGYFTLDEMEDYLETLKKSPRGVAFAEVLFSYIKSGLRIISPILVSVDRAGDDYAWVTFSNNVGTKATLVYGISAFLHDYQNGKIKPDFDLYDLIEEFKRLRA